MSVANALKEDSQHRDWKGNAQGSYRKAYEQKFGERSLVALSAFGSPEFEKWLFDTRRWSKVTMHRYYEFGQAFFNWAKKKKWIKENPFEFITGMGSGQSRSRGTRVTPKQEEALLAAAATNNWPMMRLRFIGALDTGMRRGEMMRVQVKHIDFKNWRIALPETKGDEFQFAYVETDRLKTALTERRFLGEDAFVFGTPDGRTISRNTFLTDSRKLFKAAMISYGRVSGLTWHDLRHKYISHLLDQGVPIHIVQRLARHKSIAITQRYYEASEARLRDGARQIGHDR
jgi:integrase